MAYSDAFRAEALIRLAVNKYDYKKTAEQMGVSVRTLRRWDKNATKKEIPDLLNRAIERMLMVIPDRWEGHDWAVALGILIDKWLLMQGKATERTENLTHIFDGLSEDERRTVVDEAKQILDSIGSGNGSTGGGI